MTNIEHIKELTCGEVPKWVCEQLAAELNMKDTKIKEQEEEIKKLKEIVQSLSW